MKDLLYLKDDHLKEFIEKLFVSYRESFNDAKKTLDKHSLGIAHHKVIHIISINEGITISNLLKKLKITKQSLNRVVKELIKLDIILFKKGEKDTRLKHVYLTKKGMKIFEEIFSAQKKRIYNALLNSTSNEVNNFNNVIKKIINEKI
jgi:DNA-binding MarR family transcriptional regulator